MPTVDHRGCDIYYRVSGSGPLLILQHGFFSSHADWKRYGYVDALKGDFTVATIDSLAHGQSDKPTEPALYRMPERAGDIVAVMDELGHEKAHVLGYSMGGWMAVGVAKHFPNRLASLSIGGWDCVRGMGPALLEHAGKARLSFDEYMVKARELSPPGSLDWVKGNAWMALAQCYEQLYDIDGRAETVVDLEIPVLLYNGKDDPCHDPMEAFAVKHNLTFLSLSGDHGSTMADGAADIAPILKCFLRREDRRGHESASD